MIFATALAVVLIFSGAYLIRQYLRGDLLDDGEKR